MSLTLRLIVASLLFALVAVCAAVSQKFVIAGNLPAAWITTLGAVAIFCILSLVVTSGTFWHWMQLAARTLLALILITIAAWSIGIAFGYEPLLAISVAEYGRPLFLGGGFLIAAAAVPILYSVWSQLCKHTTA